MIPITTFAGKTVAVFGLGSSGNATALALMAGGATVEAWDDSAAGRGGAEKAGIALIDLSTADWTRFAALVLAPGVPLTHPEPHWVVLKARAAGTEIIGDIELFCRERDQHAPDAPFIAITGTNGKSTTTALIAHILREAGRDVQMGGNIGVPILALEPPAKGRFHVIEMSSFQIDLTPSVNPTVGVLLNITPDHLDRHGTMENYAGVKERLVRGAMSAVVGADNDRCAAIGTSLQAAGAKVISISGIGQASAFVSDGELFGCDRRTALADLSGVVTLRGAHNGQNAAAAYAATHEVGVDDELIVAAMRTYPGLPHRMEEVGRMGDVLFINDSKATNADSTEKALLSFPRHVFWILGGKPKAGAIESLRPYFPGLVKAYLIGAATQVFAETLDGHVPYERCGTLDVAVARAAADAATFSPRPRAEGAGAGATNNETPSSTTPTPSPSPQGGGDEPVFQPVVLLSPACASYDQFANFERRGDAFRALVRALPGFVPRADEP